MSAEPEKKPGMRPGLRWLLIASLGLNLIVAGLVGGAIIGAKRMQDRPMRDMDFVSAYTRALDGKDRRAIGRSLREHYVAQGDRPGQRRATLEAVIAALKATPFDADSFQMLLESQTVAATERRAHAQDIWLKRVSAMSDEERRAYADRIVEELAKRRPPGQKQRH